MFEIIKREVIAPKTVKLLVYAPEAIRRMKAGQFVMVRVDECGERIPLSVSGWDQKAGWVRLIIQGAGRTSNEILLMKEGERFASLVGPLGAPSHSGKIGTAVLLGGGYGTGAIIPVADQLKKDGNRVIGVIGARNKDLLIMVDELSEAVDELMITTNDGSKGIKGFVTHALQKIMDREEVHHVMSVGPVPMMKAIAEMTRDKKIPTYASLNAIMVDGTGMCGACRVTVHGDTRFACIHGPDFDAHGVDFDELILRQTAYKEQEKVANEPFEGYDFSEI